MSKSDRIFNITITPIEIILRPLFLFLVRKL
jgi:hypothetical protein